MKARKVHCIYGNGDDNEGYTGRDVICYDVIQNTLLPQYPGTVTQDIYVNHMLPGNLNRVIDKWYNGQNANEAIDERAIYKITNTGVNYTSDAASSVYSYITNCPNEEEAGTVLNKLYLLGDVDPNTTSLVLNDNTVFYPNLEAVTMSLNKIITLKLSGHLIELNDNYEDRYWYLLNSDTLVTLDASGYSLNTSALSSTVLETVIANNLKSTYYKSKAPATLTTFTSQNNVWDNTLPITGSKTKTNVCDIDLTGSTFNVSPFKSESSEYIGYMAKSINVKDCKFIISQDTIFDHISCTISNLNTINVSKVSSDSLCIFDNYSGPNIDMYSNSFYGFDGLTTNRLTILKLESGATATADISLDSYGTDTMTGIKCIDLTNCYRIKFGGNCHFNGSIFTYPDLVFTPTCAWIQISGNYTQTDQNIQIGFTTPQGRCSDCSIYLNSNDVINTATTTILLDCFSTVNLTNLKPNIVYLKCVDSTRDALTSITWFKYIGSAAYIELSNLTESNMNEFFTGLGTVTTTVNINIIAATYARLSAADIAIATNKGYTVTKEA